MAKIRKVMNEGKYVFAQIASYIPRFQFDRIVVKTLWGYSENAVKTHLWSAICAYLLLALIKAKTQSKYTITEVAMLLSASVFEKTDLTELLTHLNDRLVSLLSNQNVKDQQLSIIF